VNTEDVERNLLAKLEAMGPRVRDELLNVLLMPDFERARKIGDFWSNPRSKAFAELLMDAEADKIVRGVLIGLLRDLDRKDGG
jgi:hypothetical protein